MLPTRLNLIRCVCTLDDTVPIKMCGGAAIKKKMPFAMDVAGYNFTIKSIEMGEW